MGSTIQVLYRGWLEYLTAHEFEVTVVCAPSELDDAIRARGVRLHTAPLAWSVAPWQDARAIYNLWRFFRQERFDLVEVSTAKAALVGSIAARLARQPCLVAVLRGLAYQGHRGPVSWLLRRSIRLSCRLADHVLSISQSVADEAVRDGVCARGKVRVLGMGSYRGVDLERFSPARRALGPQTRAHCAIPSDAVVVGFVGNMTRDKGIAELVTAFQRSAQKVPNLVLLIVGDYERRDRPPRELAEAIAADARIRHVGWQADPVPYFAAMDIFVLPSHREGFGNVLVEAAALGLPTITTDATGCRNAAVPDVTGLQYPVGDVERLTAAIERLALDAALRERLGTAGRQWVTEHFDQRQVWARYAEEYRRLAARGGRGAGQAY